VIDVAHILQRVSDPFTTESRFYWPLVIGVLLGMVGHTAWYALRPRKPRNPIRDRIEDFAYWVDMIAFFLVLVAVASRVRFWTILALLALDWLAIGYLYLIYAPPRLAAWAREQRRRRYIPSPKRRAVRR
jgi:hypothetical protein